MSLVSNENLDGRSLNGGWHPAYLCILLVGLAQHCDKYRMLVLRDMPMMAPTEVYIDIDEIEGLAVKIHRFLAPHRS